IHTRLQRHAQQRRAEENQAAVAGLAEAICNMDVRVQRIDRCLQRVLQRVDQMQLSQGGSNNDLRQAVHLVRDGATTEQLVDLCGLTRGEAELFQRLHS
ncbi:MAG: DUF2802 domain-containing protein, partial [Gammaproteobacteria bacterium]|nr:DUF2802 domain-containing protein [Gammaproteobacteria bacterium]